MSRDEPQWAEVAGAGIVVIIFGAIALSAAEAWAPFLGLFDSAAGGALIGFSGAMLAVSWQLRRQAETVRRDDDRKLITIATQFFHCRVLAHRAYQACKLDYHDEQTFEGIRSQIQMLRSIPAADIPHWRAAFQISQINVAFIELAAGWANAEGATGANEKRRQYVDVFLDWLVGSETELRNLCQSRGTELPDISYELQGTGIVAHFGIPPDGWQ